MRRIKVNLKEKSYDILIGNNILSSLGNRMRRLNIGEDAIIITNAKIKRLLADKLRKTLISSGFSVRFELIPDSEKSKSQIQAFMLINKISKFDVKRRMFIIALGGGVVGDLSGFVAAVYKRGIDYVQIPTTLLSQVDSAIGGKVGIDLMAGKNLVGAFYQPRLVLSDVNILSTLSKKQMRVGLSEVIKYAIIKDSYLFNYLERNYINILNFKKQVFESIVYRCSLIKSEIIESDEREAKGIRTVLNFGHTIGHAVEAAGGYGRYNHGEAVAIGMICAADIAYQIGLLEINSFKRIESLISKIGLPVFIRRVHLKTILKAYQHDKKFIHKKNRFVLPESIGKVILYEGVPLKVIKKSIAKRIKGGK